MTTTEDGEPGRPPHRRVQRMRRHLYPIVVGPPPAYAARAVVEKSDEAVRRFLETYGATIRRRLDARRRRPMPGQREEMFVSLDDDPTRPLDRVVVRVELRPRRTDG